MKAAITASEAHDAMVRAGWTPLVAIRETMHFVRKGRRATLVYSSDASGAMEQSVLRTTQYVQIVKKKNGRVVAVDATAALGGRARSAAKRLAARANGRKGGRPSAR